MWGYPLAMCISNETVFIAMVNERNNECAEYVLVTDLQGDTVRTWGSRGYGPGCFSFINSIVCANHGAILVSDNGRVQAFRPDGLCFRSWTSAVCGNFFGFSVRLGCTHAHGRELVFMLDRARANVDVFELAGPGLFEFPVIANAQDISCGPEEVYVMDWTRVVVYSAVDGTKLRTLVTILASPPNLASVYWKCTRLTYGPSGAIAIVSFFYGSHLPEDGICSHVISAADGSRLGRTSCNTKPSILAWCQTSSALVGIHAYHRIEDDVAPLFTVTVDTVDV